MGKTYSDTCIHRKMFCAELPYTCTQRHFIVKVNCFLQVAKWNPPLSYCYGHSKRTTEFSEFHRVYIWWLMSGMKDNVFSWLLISISFGKFYSQYLRWTGETDIYIYWLMISLGEQCLCRIHMLVIRLSVSDCYCCLRVWNSDLFIESSRPRIQ